MKIIMYSKANCRFCRLVEAELRSRHLQYEKRDIGVNQSFRNELLTQYPDTKTVPQIIIDDVKIGGYDDLKLFLKENTSQTEGENS